MIVDDLYFVNVALFPYKTNPPPIINPNARLPRAISFESLEPIPRRHAQILQRLSAVEHPELSESRPQEIRRKRTDSLSLEKRLSLAGF